MAVKSVEAGTVLQLDEDLLARAQANVAQGLAPPPEIYQAQIRGKIDWSKLPLWARPTDPDLFDGCCHEG